jgi:hypothetical protein
MYAVVFRATETNRISTHLTPIKSQLKNVNGECRSKWKVGLRRIKI